MFGSQGRAVRKNRRFALNASRLTGTQNEAGSQGETVQRPAMWFYPGDWLHDASLRSVSPAARALWMDMICIMHQAQPYGHLLLNQKVIQVDKLEVMLGGYPHGSMQVLIDELETAGVFSRNGDGSIFCRRMVRDEKLRQLRQAAGLKGGNPKLRKSILLKQKVKQQLKQVLNQEVKHDMKTEELKIEDMNTEEKKRPRNEIWDALVDVTNSQPATRTEQSNWGKACRELKEAGATAIGIHVRANHYRQKYPGAALTVNAMVKHWGDLEHPPAVVDGKPREKTREERLTEIQTSIDQVKAERAAKQ